MQIKERVVDDVLVLDVEGKILLGEGDVQLKQRVTDLVKNGHRRLVMNLGNVPYMDSSGLGEIVRCYTAVRRAGGEMKLANLTKRLIDLLTITKLLTVFETYPNEEVAIASFHEIVS